MFEIKQDHYSSFHTRGNNFITTTIVSKQQQINVTEPLRGVSLMRGRRKWALDLIQIFHISGQLPYLQTLHLSPNRYLPVKILLCIFSFLIAKIDSVK